MIFGGRWVCEQRMHFRALRSSFLGLEVDHCTHMSHELAWRHV